MNATAGTDATQRRGRLARLGVRAKLLIGFLAIALLMTVGATVSLLGTSRSLRAVDELLDVEARIADLALQSTASMLKARRHEKDFLLSRLELNFAEARARYATPLRIHGADIRDHMAKIRRLADDATMVEHTWQIEQAVGQYESGFLRTVELYGQLGRVDTGLEGRFRARAHDIEAIVNRHRAQHLLAGLLTLRRLEKDYLLRGRERDAAVLRAGVGEFSSDAARAPLPQAVREQLRDLVGEYLAAFEQYVEINNQIEAATGNYLRAVRVVEPLLEKLHVKAVTKAAVTRDEVHEIALVSRWITSAVAVLAAVTGLLVGILVIRNISGTVRACVNFASRLAQGNLDARMRQGGRDEFAVLTASLNTMADSLADSRRALEQRASELAGANRTLQDEVAEHKHAREEISRLNRELEARIEARKILNELTSVLQSCQSSAEAYGAIARSSQKLFPGRSGVLYLMHPSRDYLRSMATWGEPLLREPQLDPASCWALRRGTVYCVNDATSELACLHQQSLGARIPSSLCVPMTAQSDTFGLVYLEYSGGAEHAPREIPAGDESLAVSLARESALALANIRLQETLRDQSIRDSLTGLYNRRYLEESLERELARAQRTRNSLAVLMLDADHFKRFNDQFGHDTGDMVLRVLGKTIKESCRRNDLPCRFGGEEFAVVLTDAGKDAAAQWCERLLDRVRKLDLKSGAGSIGKVTISAGVALYPEHGAHVETLLQAADTALYQAKNSGRDRLVVYQGTTGGTNPENMGTNTRELKPAT